VPFLTNFKPAPSTILEIPRKPGSSSQSKDYVVEEAPTIRFDVLSEDLQRPLYGSVFLDFPQLTKFPAICLLTNIGAGTLDEPRPQACKLIIPSSVEPGCRSVTALVSHEVSILAASPAGDLAQVTWWAQIGFDSSLRDFVPCGDLTPADAGGDARADGGAP
jgi:hypothetical protein